MDGCKKDANDNQPNWNPGYYTTEERSVAHVRCCAMDGSSCTSSRSCEANSAITYSEAVAYCAAEGQRLCYKEEIEEGKCCETGGMCDNYITWTKTTTGYFFLLFITLT